MWGRILSLPHNLKMELIIMKLHCIAILLSILPAMASTPAETAIAKCQEQIAKRPDYFANYNALAMAYARRARETSDVAYYAKAEETLKKSFALAADNYEGLKVQTWLLLGRHEFAKAREVAATLNRRTPDDITVYGYLVDANAELGNYQEAVDAAQWMLNLRPGNVPGLTRAAYLRELHGDFDGAIEMMQSAYDSTPYQELEDRAWLLTQIAHLHLSAGHVSEAERFASGALGVFGDYHYALGVLGQIRMAGKQYAEAVELFQKRYSAAPHAENLFALAEALEKSGRHEEARRAFSEFEQKALAESKLTDNANHELVAYYTDYARKPAEALRIAQLERTRRHDAFTLDALAWAFAAHGDFARAGSEMKQALAFGLKDPSVLEHARAIDDHLGSR
jgi:tetratricopeptide (TPR) repeat protein